MLYKYRLENNNNNNNHNNNIDIIIIIIFWGHAVWFLCVRFLHRSCERSIPLQIHWWRSPEVPLDGRNAVPKPEADYEYSQIRHRWPLSDCVRWCHSTAGGWICGQPVHPYTLLQSQYIQWFPSISIVKKNTLGIGHIVTYKWVKCKIKVKNHNTRQRQGEMPW